MRKQFITSLVFISMLQGHEAISGSKENRFIQNISSISAPVELHAKPKENGAILHWQPVKGAEGYRIYFEQELDVTSYSPTLDSISAHQNSYHVHDLTPGVLYKFAVSALHSSKESSISNQVGVIPLAGIKKQLLQDVGP